MQRPAPTDRPIHDLLQSRWSPVGFADRAVDDETLGSLFEAARWAPSSYNEQPWSFVVATREQQSEFERLLRCLVEPNQVWAQHAAVLFIAVARRQFERNAKDNAHAWYDVGQAVAHLSVEATARGLVVHQMAGFDAEAARRELDIPETHAPVAAVAVGYVGDGAGLPAEVRQRDESPRVRRSAEEFVFGGQWGERAGFLSG